MVYVTFRIQKVHYSPTIFFGEEKYSVACDNMDDAYEVAQDAVSLDGVKNVRIRKCGKPYGRNQMAHDEYFEYKWW